MLRASNSLPSVPESCLDPQGRRHAIVFSGGGARAAFEVGVLAALIQGASPATGFWPLRSNILCGSSLGAYHATFLANHSENGDLRAGLDKLVRIWQRRIARSSRWPDGGIYRLRGVPYFLEVPGSFAADPVRSVFASLRALGFWANFLGRQTQRIAASRRTLLGRVLETIRVEDFFDIEPFRQLLHETLDLSRLRTRNDVFVAVAVTHFLTGSPKIYFRNQLGTSDGSSVLLASASVPGLVPTVQLRGRPYVDGSLSMSVPFLPAMTAGTEVLHVIRAWTPFHKSPDHDLSTFGTTFRMMQILMTTSVYNKIHSLEHFLGKIEELLDKAKLEWAAPDSFRAPWTFDQERRLLRNWAPSMPPSPSEIHFYRLNETYPGTDGFLDFRANRIHRLMGHGFSMAEEHDCEESGCWLPESEEHHNTAETA